MAPVSPSRRTAQYRRCRSRTTRLLPCNRWFGDRWGERIDFAAAQAPRIGSLTSGRAGATHSAQGRNPASLRPAGQAPMFSPAIFENSMYC